MLVTSKEANKLLKQLENDRENLLLQEQNCSTFLASVGEDIESCRPEYDYDRVQEELMDIENKILKIKHQINKFNIETMVNGFDKTIDEMLVYIPQLTNRKAKLSSMMKAMPKTREITNMRSTIVDYRYTNYDIEVAKKDYSLVCEKLARAQIALDTINVTKQFEIEA